MLVWMTMTLLGSGAALFGLTRKEQPPECPPGTHWIEETDPAVLAPPDQEPIARMGWCARDDGVREGPMRTYWANGWLRREVTFAAGIETGPVRTLYEDGRPETETRQVEGKTDGRFQQWHRSGERARAMVYTQGQASGWAVFWDEQGRRTQEGAFLDGKKQGEWDAWYANGVLREVARWRDGRLDGRRFQWTEGGVFHLGGCFDAGEQLWETKVEVDARTRACRPF
jgi:hypothetical protein